MNARSHRQRRLPLHLLCFAAGAAVVSWQPWRQSLPAGAGQNSHPGPPSAPVVAIAGAIPPEARDPQADRQAELAFTGLSAPPTMEEVLHAAGMDRRLRLAIWLQTASSADIAAMLERCREIPEDFNLTQPLWERWVEIDRDAALKNPVTQKQAWEAIARLDPEGALRGDQPPPGVLEAVAKADPLRAIAWLRQHHQQDDGSIWFDILEGLMDRDPAAAAGLLLKRGFDGKGGFFMEETLKAWSARDSAAALDWAMHLKNPGERDQAVEATFSAHLRADPSGAMKKAAALPPGQLRARLMTEAAGPLVLVDPAAAAEAVASLPGPLHRCFALAGQISSLAQTDSAKALELFQQLPAASAPDLMASLMDPFSNTKGWPGSADWYEKIPEAVKELTRTQPAGVADGLAGLPPSTGFLLENAISQWTSQDAAAASAWVNQLPPGSARDTAVEALTLGLSSGPEPDFEAALAWSLSAPPDERLRRITSTLDCWRRENPAAARAALTSLPLTEAERAEVARRANF